MENLLNSDAKNAPFTLGQVGEPIKRKNEDIWIDFKNLDDKHIQDLLTLEREKAIYSDQWLDELDDFRHMRIRFKDSEITEFVRSMKAFDRFLGSNAQWASEVKGIPKDIAARADAYHMTTNDGKTIGPPWHCAAGFMGRHIEVIVCGMDSSRREVLEEQGTAAFLSTIRRAVDALTPAVRCFSNREKHLAPWSISREDDIRDLLYAMLRGSVKSFSLFCFLGSASSVSDCLGQ